MTSSTVTTHQLLFFKYHFWFEFNMSQSSVGQDSTQLGVSGVLVYTVYNY